MSEDGNDRKDGYSSYFLYKIFVLREPLFLKKGERSPEVEVRRNSRCPAVEWENFAKLVR